MATRDREFQMLFILGCIILALFICNISIHGLHFRPDLFTLWSLDWIGFKEENLVTFIIWVLLLVFFRSIAKYVCIVLHFSKLSAAEALQNPMDYVMLGNSNSNAIGQKSRCSRVVTIVAFSTLGILICGPVIYALAIDDGSDVSKDLLTAWVVALELNMNTISFVLVGWGNYKEKPSCVDSNMWIVLLVLFGSVIIWCYIVTHLLEILPLFD